jgi:tripartite-type tricarboxylate transporter receptor subunit TctC
MRSIDRRSAVAFGLLATAGLVAPPHAEGQEAAAYPTRPVRLLVGFPPGGPLDFMTRALAERLAQRLGQPFLVENRPGASANLAAEAVARAAPPDGHLLLMGNHSNLAVNAVLQRDLPFDPARDLAPVAQITAVPLVVAVAADLPARSMAELVALARARPGQLNAGTPGTATLQHLTLELLKQRAGGLDIVPVSFRGGVEVGRELMAGRLHLGIDASITFRAGVEAGRVRVLATTHAERLPMLPELPAVAEAPGLEGFEASGFVGVAGPAGMPRPAVARLEAAVGWAMRETDLPRLYEEQGLLARYAGAEGFAALIARDRERWARVVREAGITPG